jgi:L-threonylcarbamoyladenylate synthase
MEATADQIAQAIRIVKNGGLVIYPTDTAFAIGCRIDNPEAVDRLFSIRERPLTQATPVLVSSIDQALSYFIQPNDIVRRLMAQHWPGALTIISHCDSHVIYSPIRGGGNTIGLRQPNHETAHALIAGVGVPLLGPSANFHGKPTPYTFESLDPELCTLVDVVLPGVCSVGLASTVVDCTDEVPRVLRQGTITVE